MNYRKAMEAFEAQRRNVQVIEARIGTTGAVYDQAMKRLFKLGSLVDELDANDTPDTQFLFLSLMCEHCKRVHSDDGCGRASFFRGKDDEN